MDPTFRAGLSPRNVSAPIYFPPPPKMTAAASASSDLRNKKGAKLNFGKPRSASITGAVSSSQKSKPVLQHPPKSILKHTVTATKRHRQWILLFLLVVSFTILIVSMIFAYCAALPHSDNVFGGQATATATDTAASSSTSSYGLGSRLTLRDSPKYTADTSGGGGYNKTIEEALAEDASNRVRFNQPSAMAALTFYTSTLPLLTMLHTSVELLTSLVRPATTQSTRLGDALRFRQPCSHPTAGESMLTKRRVGTLFSFTVSACLCLGWLVMQMFWLNCEIILFSPSSTAEAVCPVQIRGHRMGGVSELSIGKVVLAFVVVLGYVGYCVYLVTCVDVFGERRVEGGNGIGMRTVARFERRARFEKAEAREREMESAGDRDRDVESVVIGIDMEKMDVRR